MNWIRFYIVTFAAMTVACQSMNDTGTIAQLRHQEIDVRQEAIQGGLEKAIQGYQRFLEETPDTALAPEAIRRLADLKIEKEYGLHTTGDQSAHGAADGMDPPENGRPDKGRPNPCGRRTDRSAQGVDRRGRGGL